MNPSTSFRLSGLAGLALALLAAGPGCSKLQTAAVASDPTPAADKAPAADTLWMTDAPAALARAAAEKKPLLLDFTGSDWCVWCHKLDGEVFSRDEFQAYARQNLVLLKLDFPQRTPQAEALARQNRALAEKYQIQGFPTIIVLDPAGEKLGELGYLEGGATAWLAALREITRA